MRYLPLLLAACTTSSDPIPPAKVVQSQIETIDAPKDPKGDLGLWPVPLVDKNGELLVAYCDAYMGDVKLARKHAGAWQISLVEEKDAVGKYLTGVMGSDGPELIYLDQTRHTLRFAHQVGGAWAFQDIASDKNDIGISGRFVIGAKGERLLVHYNTRNELLLTTGVAKEGALAWTTTKLGDAGAVYNIDIGLSVGADDVLHLSYPDWHMMSATFRRGLVPVGGALSTIDLDEDLTPGMKSALVSDGPVDDIFYMTAQHGLLYEIRVQDGKASEKKKLTGNVNNLAALKARDGRLFLALQVGRSEGLGDGALDLAVRKDEHWERVGLDSTRPVGQYMALAEGPAINGVAQIHLVYYDGHARRLRYALIH